MSKKKTWHGLEAGQVYEATPRNIRIIISFDDHDVTYHDNESGEEETIYLSSFVRWIKQHKAKLMPCNICLMKWMEVKKGG